MWETIVGGSLAILGGFFATWMQIKHSRKIKMDEVIAEKMVSINAEAYVYMKEIRSMIQSEDTVQALSYVLSKDSWLFRNRLFLAGKFPDKWLTIRNGLDRVSKLPSETEEENRERKRLLTSLDATAEDAILEIYKAIIGYLRHVSTLASGSILLMVAFMEKLFANPQWKWCVVVALSWR